MPAFCFAEWYRWRTFACAAVWPSSARLEVAKNVSWSVRTRKPESESTRCAPGTVRVARGARARTAAARVRARRMHQHSSHLRYRLTTLIRALAPRGRLRALAAGLQLRQLPPRRAGGGRPVAARAAAQRAMRDQDEGQRLCCDAHRRAVRGAPRGRLSGVLQADRPARPDHLVCLRRGAQLHSAHRSGRRFHHQGGDCAGVCAGTVRARARRCLLRTMRPSRAPLRRRPRHTSVQGKRPCLHGLAS